MQGRAQRAFMGLDLGLASPSPLPQPSGLPWTSHTLPFHQTY